MIQVTLYIRKDCHLCEQAIQDLNALQEKYPHRLNIVDIDGSEELKNKYGVIVPVIDVGPYQLKAPFTFAISEETR